MTEEREPIFEDLAVPAPTLEQWRDYAKKLEGQLREATERDYEAVLELVGLNLREVMRYCSKSQELARRLFRVDEKKREGALGRLLGCIRRIEALVQTPEVSKFQMERAARTGKTREQLQRTSANLVKCRADLDKALAALREIREQVGPPNSYRDGRYHTAIRMREIADAALDGLREPA